MDVDNQFRPNDATGAASTPAAAEGGTAEWRSRVLPRSQRRTARVEEAIFGMDLSGTKSRRLKGALAPLLRGGSLSNDAVSRLVGRLKSAFEE